jgi:hypothetical protein
MQCDGFGWFPYELYLVGPLFQRSVPGCVQGLTLVPLFLGYQFGSAAVCQLCGLVLGLFGGEDFPLRFEGGHFWSSGKWFWFLSLSWVGLRFSFCVLER